MSISGTGWQRKKIDFSQEVGDAVIKDEILKAINDSNAFQKFKKVLQHHATRDWFRFKRMRFAEIAKYWCETQEVGYKEI